jgi:uncharacterized protein
MNESPRKQLVRDVFAALARGDVDAFLGKIADDVRWTIQGSTKFSGTYHGKADVVARLLQPLGAELDGHLAITVERLVEEGDRIAVQGHGRSKTKDGKRYDNTYCWVYRIADGRIQEVDEYLDTELVTAAFGR